MKPINKIPDAIYKDFENTNPEFLIIGIKKAGTPNAQQHKVFGNYAKDENDMLSFLANDNITRFKVFKVAGIHSGEGVLRQQAKEYVTKAVEERERKEFERLKAKYEKELITII